MPKILQTAPTALVLGGSDRPYEELETAGARSQPIATIPAIVAPGDYDPITSIPKQRRKKEYTPPYQCTPPANVRMPPAPGGCQDVSECIRVLPQSFASAATGIPNQLNIVQPIGAGAVFRVAAAMRCFLQFWDASSTAIITGWASGPGTFRYVCPWANIGAVTVDYLTTDAELAIVLLWLE